jgi:serine/threonine protein kinase
MGQVFRARLTGPGGASKPVALKLIHQHLCAQEHFRRMFHEELRIAMALNHRNIVQTFDGGESEGRQYLVMELVPGLSLSEFLRRMPRSPLPADIALFIAMEVCAALDYGHTFQPEYTGHPGLVLHRDVSPTNILLSEQGDVKLTDYGVAKATGSLALSSPDLVKGKLGYMAAEQAKGEAGVQSDLFSLGAVLYRMLAGRRIRKKVNLEQLREGGPEIVSLAGLRPDLPRSLADLVTCCLATRVDLRPESAWALREALAREATALQQGPDLHGRMRSFHGDLARGRPAAADSAAQLAQVMRRRAQIVPARPAVHPTATTALSMQSTALEEPTSSGWSGHTRWLLRRGWPALVLLVALLFWPTQRTDAGLVLHISPAGATVVVNGKVLVKKASSKVRVAAPPAKHQQIVVVHPDYHPRKKIVAAPHQGFRHVYIGLKRRQGGEGLPFSAADRSKAWLPGATALAD